MIENRIYFKEFKLSPVSEREALRYAGAKEDDAKAAAVLRECESELQPLLKGLAVYRAVDFSADGDACTIDRFTVRSKSLASAFIGVKKIIIFVATVGLSPDRLVSKYERISLAKAHIMNALAAERIEALCDSVYYHIAETLSAEGYGATPRFSAGYGDLDIGFQREIFALLNPEKYIGVTLSDSLLMTPTKSVSALIGIKNENDISRICK